MRSLSKVSKVSCISFLIDPFGYTKKIHVKCSFSSHIFISGQNLSYFNNHTISLIFFRGPFFPLRFSDATIWGFHHSIQLPGPWWPSIAIHGHGHPLEDEPKSLHRKKVGYFTISISTSKNGLFGVWGYIYNIHFASTQICSFLEGYVHEHERLEPENAWKEKLQTPSCTFSGFYGSSTNAPPNVPPAPRNTGLIFGLIKGNHWLTSHTSWFSRIYFLVDSTQNLEKSTSQFLGYLKFWYS